MLAILVPFLLSTALQEGDRWTIERTTGYTQASGRADAKNVDSLSYRVLQAGPEFTAVSCEVIPTESSRSKPSKRVTSFKPNGVLLSREDASDPNIERISRMEWTATEARQGIAWSRNWPTSSDLLEAKVIVKPTARAVDETTMSVTYKEGEAVKCVATIKILNNVRIVEDLTVTISNVEVPGSTKPGSLFVTEKLKEIHLVTR